MRTGIFTLVFFSGFALPIAAEDTTPAKDKPRYEWRSIHDPSGIGKFYMGREIAHVMGHLGASWLERPEREEEENPKKIIEALKIKPGETVVDLGAGSGYYTFRMLPLVGEKGKVVAVDVQKEMLEIIQKRMKKEMVSNIDLILGDVKNPKIPANSVDLILMVDVYHEFEYPFEMTEKMIESLKVGGRLVFVEFRLEDPKVPIKLVHKMMERQVIKEMNAFANLKHKETIGTLPWQHVIVFEKTEAKKE